MGIHKTFDVKYINLSSMGAHWAWPETHDHAKWGISVQSDWVCVGDINRMISQRKRGGGTIALQNKTLWSALNATTLIVAPPGHSRAEAVNLIKSTHSDESTARANTTAATKSARTKTASPVKGKGKR
jgi:deoxyribonuclease II